VLPGFVVGPGLASATGGSLMSLAPRGPSLCCRLIGCWSSSRSEAMRQLRAKRVAWARTWGAQKARQGVALFGCILRPDVNNDYPKETTPDGSRPPLNEGDDER